MFSPERIPQACEVVAFHSEIGKVLTDAVVRKMQLQCEVLVSTKFNSILRRKGKEDLLNFSWDALL